MSSLFDVVLEVDDPTDTANVDPKQKLVYQSLSRWQVELSHFAHRHIGERMAHPTKDFRRFVFEKITDEEIWNISKDAFGHKHKVFTQTWELPSGTDVASLGIITRMSVRKNKEDKNPERYQLGQKIHFDIKWDENVEVSNWSDTPFVIKH